MARPPRRAYSMERHLVEHFARCLRSGDTPWGTVNVGFEFQYDGGCADVLALCSQGHVIAFEAKLVRWRDALHQAYRTRCFANRAYVILPAACARVAAKYEHEFLRRRVGLCSMSVERGIEVLLEADHAVPLQPWVTTRAVGALGKKGGKKGCRSTRSSEESPSRSVRIEA
jgi:hypothetical protein